MEPLLLPNAASNGIFYISERHSLHLRGGIFHSFKFCNTYNSLKFRSTPHGKEIFKFYTMESSKQIWKKLAPLHTLRSSLRVEISLARINQLLGLKFHVEFDCIECENIRIFGRKGHSDILG